MRACVRAFQGLKVQVSASVFQLKHYAYETRKAKKVLRVTFCTLFNYESNRFETKIVYIPFIYLLLKQQLMTYTSNKTRDSRTTILQKTETLIRQNGGRVVMGFHLVDSENLSNIPTSTKSGAYFREEAIGGDWWCIRYKVTRYIIGNVHHRV